jgi:hypothetical protein
MRKCLSASPEHFTTILIADRPILCLKSSRIDSFALALLPLPPLTLVLPRRNTFAHLYTRDIGNNRYMVPTIHIEPLAHI